MRLFITLCFCLVFYSISSRAQSMIRGTITEKSSKKPISSATIRVLGTYYGAISDANGNYAVKKIPGGKNYTLEITRIGYRTIKKTGVSLSKSDTLIVNFSMDESNVSLDKDVLVIGERPLVDVEETQSMRAVNRENIQQMVAENVTDVLTQQTGLISQNNEIFIRGGRGYEAAYLLDGVSIQDPLAGTGFGLQLSANSLQEVEVITGGFNPEYGQATSGVINIKTREGASKYEGSAALRRAWRMFDRSALDRDTNSSFLTDILELTFSGPEPITSQLLPALGITLPGKISFFTNFYGNVSDDLVPEFARAPVKTSLFSNDF
ncbi:MAG: carboxypeptidase-like regulatory domain-containing protein, partial [Ignavibacteria bacterium]